MAPAQIAQSGSGALSLPLLLSCLLNLDVCGMRYEDENAVFLATIFSTAVKAPDLSSRDLRMSLYYECPCLIVKLMI
jgi:hypothetical protein